MKTQKPLYYFMVMALACGVAFSGCGKDAPAAAATPLPSPSPTPVVTATPAPTPRPTATPAPTAAPEPTATPEPYAGLSYYDWLTDPDSIVLYEPEDFARVVEAVTTNPESYLEKRFCIAGLYVLEQPEGLGVTAHYVFRNGPVDPELEDEDDGDDVFYGMQFIPPEGFSAADGDWVIVTGTLRTVLINEYPFLALDETQAIIDNENPGSITLEPES